MCYVIADRYGHTFSTLKHSKPQNGRSPRRLTENQEKASYTLCMRLSPFSYRDLLPLDQVQSLLTAGGLQITRPIKTVSLAGECGVHKIFNDKPLNDPRQAQTASCLAQVPVGAIDVMKGLGLLSETTPCRPTLLSETTPCTVGPR
jgi:hypothetical protein